MIIKTQRQREVFNLILKGYKPKEIATELGIAYRTVKAHINRMAVVNGIDHNRYVVCVRLIYLYYEEKIAELKEGATLAVK